MLDFWNMTYRKGGEYRDIYGRIDHTPYLLTKSGHRVSIGGTIVVYTLLIGLPLWFLI